MLHIELAVSSGFEDCNGENLQTSYNIIRFFLKFLISLFMTEDIITRNGVLASHSSRNSLKVVGLL